MLTGSRFGSSRRARRFALPVFLLLSAALAYAGSQAGVTAPTDRLTVEQVMKMPKIDAHAHVAALGPGQREAFIQFLEHHELKWLNICVGGMNWSRLKQQIQRAQELHAAYPKRIAWATSFNLTNWGAADWEQSAIQAVSDGYAHGAVATKVWKDIGMELKDRDGRYVMIDDARMNGVLEAVGREGHTLVAHLGEPRNCWLPLESMTTESDRRYFAGHPQYHGYLHPEVPDYAKQIAARDAMLERHPGLRVVGCHLGSLEYDVDEVAKRLDKYPNLAVDLAARMVHLQIQPRDKVRDFILRYQDRLLYGTDLDFGSEKADAASTAQGLDRLDSAYRLDAAWLATDQEVEVPRARAGFKSKGLALPPSVLRKIYYENARKWYPGL